MKKLRYMMIKEFKDDFKNFERVKQILITQGTRNKRNKKCNRKKVKYPR